MDTTTTARIESKADGEAWGALDIDDVVVYRGQEPVARESFEGDTVHGAFAVVPWSDAGQAPPELRFQGERVVTRFVGNQGVELSWTGQGPDLRIAANTIFWLSGIADSHLAPDLADVDLVVRTARFSLNQNAGELRLSSEAAGRDLTPPLATPF